MADFPRLAVTVREAARDEVLKEAYKLQAQAKEKYGLEVKVEWTQSSEVQVLITFIKDILGNPVLAALIWALVAAFLLEIAKYLLRRVKNQEMAYAQSTDFLSSKAKVDLTSLMLEKSEQLAGSRFRLTFNDGTKKHRITISESCELEKYETE